MRFPALPISFVTTATQRDQKWSEGLTGMSVQLVLGHGSIEHLHKHYVIAGLLHHACSCLPIRLLQRKWNPRRTRCKQTASKSAQPCRALNSADLKSTWPDNTKQRHKILRCRQIPERNSNCVFCVILVIHTLLNLANSDLGWPQIHVAWQDDAMTWVLHQRWLKPLVDKQLNSHFRLRPCKVPLPWQTTKRADCKSTWPDSTTLTEPWVLRWYQNPN